MAETAAVVPSGRADVARRWGVTLALAGFAWALQRVPAPFLDARALVPSSVSVDSPFVSVVHLGLAPVLVAFCIVELVALAHPRLRRIRHGSAAERAGLARATWFLAIAIAAFQAVSVTTALARALQPYAELGTVRAISLALTFVAGTSLLAVVALAIGRHGVGNGFAVLFASQIAVALPGSFLRMAEAARQGGVVLPLALELGALALVLRMAWGDPRQPVRVPMPTCSLLPWITASSALLVPALFGGLLDSDGYRRLNHVLFEHHDAFALALSLAFALLFARLFSAAPRVAASWSAAGLREPADPEAVIAAVVRAHRASILLVAAVAALPFLARAFDPRAYLQLGVLGPAILGTTVMDLVAETRARARFGPLVSAFPFQRVYAVEPALAALAEAGIPAVARARYFRLVQQFFDPEAPVELLVPPERAEQAARICAPIACPETVEPDARASGEVTA